MDIVVKRDLYRNLKKLVGIHITQEELIDTMRIISLPESIEIAERILPFKGIYFSQAWIEKNILLKG